MVFIEILFALSTLSVFGVIIYNVDSSAPKLIAGAALMLSVTTNAIIQQHEAIPDTVQITVPVEAVADSSNVIGSVNP